MNGIWWAWLVLGCAMLVAFVCLPLAVFLAVGAGLIAVLSDSPEAEDARRRNRPMAHRARR